MRSKRVVAFVLGALVVALFILVEGGCGALISVPDLVYAPADATTADGSSAADAFASDAGAADGTTSVCTDTNTDPSNCGACGHSCLGGGCDGGSCTPAAIVIYDGGVPGAISVQQGFVYWVDNALNGPTGNTAILRVPTNTPAVTGPITVAPVATSTARPIIELHPMAGGLFYFAQPSGDDSTTATAFMERLDLTKLTVSRVVGNVPYGQGISDDTQNLYWVDIAGSTFEVRALDTRNAADPSSVISGVDNHGPYVTAWAGGRLFWGEDACKLNTASCPVVGCAATPSSNTCTTTSAVIPATGDVTALVANDTTLFAGTARGGIAQYGVTSNATLTTIPGPAGATENEPFVINMAVDAHDLYWVTRSDSSDMGAIFGCPLTSSGGVVAQCETPHVIMDNVSKPNGIAVDDTAVYFGVASTGTIYRLAR